MTAQTLSNYKRAFRNFSYFVCAMPVGGLLTKSKLPLLSPPLGDGVHTGLALAVAAILAGTAAILPAKLTTPTWKSLVLIPCFVLALFSGVWYFYLSQEYVVSIPVQGKLPLTVSIGTVESQFAQDHFPGKTTAYMLQRQGPNEYGVQQLWTPDSIHSVRLRLFVSSLGLLVPVNLIVRISRESRPNPTARPQADPLRNHKNHGCGPAVSRSPTRHAMSPIPRNARGKEFDPQITSNAGPTGKKTSSPGKPRAKSRRQ